MMKAIQQTFGAALMPRLVLFINHVLSAEPAATERLRLHAGKRIQLQLRQTLPTSPLLGWLATDVTARVTPAGLLEWDRDGIEVADLLVTVDASNPAKTLADAMSGERPHVDVAGDASLAADVNWLAEHLRWDVQDDLARVVGERPAAQMVQFGTLAAAGLRSALQLLSQSTLRARAAPTAAPDGEPPPR